jgi:hypothetical protein
MSDKGILKLKKKVRGILILAPLRLVESDSEIVEARNVE